MTCVSVCIRMLMDTEYLPPPPPLVLQYLTIIRGLYNLVYMTFLSNIMILRIVSYRGTLTVTVFDQRRFHALKHSKEHVIQGSQLVVHYTEPEKITE